MVEADEGLSEDGQQIEEVQSLTSEGLEYENWEDNCLVKFSEFLGFSTVGFETKILDLMRKMVAMQQINKRKRAVTVSRCKREF